MLLVLWTVMAVLLIAFVFGNLFTQSTSVSDAVSVPAVKKTLSETVTSTGQIISTGKTNVSTQVSGTIKEVYVQDGDSIAAGDKIAEIELDAASKEKQTQNWASYLKAKETLEKAQNETHSLRSTMYTKWKTYLDLSQSADYDSEQEREGAAFQSAQDDWRAAENAFKNQQTSISQAQAALSAAYTSYQQTSSTITAPQDGIVSNISYHPGMTISQSTGANATTSTTIATITSESKTIAQMNISELDITKVQVGQEVQLTLDAYPDQTFTGRVLSIEQTGETDSGVTKFPVLVEVETNGKQLLSQMTMSAVIAIQTKQNALTVPNSAIEREGKNAFVRVRTNDTEKRVPVVLGMTTDTETEIIRGIKEGELVLLSFQETDSESNTSQGEVFIKSGGL